MAVQGRLLSPPRVWRERGRPLPMPPLPPGHTGASRKKSLGAPLQSQPALLLRAGRSQNHK